MSSASLGTAPDRWPMLADRLEDEEARLDGERGRGEALVACVRVSFDPVPGDEVHT